jgi:hypothetical protein
VVGFCFAHGIARRRKKLVEYSIPGEPVGSLKRPDISPSPFVGDCLIEECNLAYAHSFVRRVREADAVKGKRAPVPFVFARRFVHEAFTFLREQGILTWTHSQLLGTKTAEAIQRILSISENIVAQQNLDPQLFTEVFEGFENFQGLFGQLKGKLFELLMAYFHQRRYQETKLAWQFDVDITAFQDAEAVLVECKGIKIDGQVEEGEVSKHFTRRLPLARSILRNETSRPVRKFKGLVITTGGFDDATVKKYNTGDYKPRPDTTFELWDRTQLLEELRRSDQNELVSIIDRYYQ